MERRWVAPDGVSRPSNHVGDVVVTSRRARTRFVAKAVETALRKATAPLAHRRRGRLLVGQPFRRFEHGAASQRLRRLAAPPEAFELPAFLVRQLDFHCDICAAS